MKLALGLVAAALALPASAAAGTAQVNVQFQEFGPSQLDVLPGETVQWSNVSERRHTVTADNGEFDSGDLFPDATFTRMFDSAGAFPYHCTVHDGMIGEVDVRPVILGPLPVAPIPAGDPLEFAGRTANPAEPVLVQRSTGSEFHTIATATPNPDGTWKTAVAAQSTGDYRAAVGAGVSGVRRVIVSDRKILVRATRTGVAVTVTPALPYARVVLQQELPERFGWWPERRTRLDYVSKASFRVARPARVRVVLVDKDGWTTLASSAELQLGHAGKKKRASHPMPMTMHH